jgi:long-chain acyl-CoA synthetase
MTRSKPKKPHDLNETHLHCLLYWEKHQPQKNYFVQPLPSGEVVRYTWRQVADQVRRMAAHLISLNLPARSQIAIFGKNSAHWIMADLAIWMAGHVSVPLYTTLNVEGATHVLTHSDAKLLFIGKLDGKGDSWNEVKGIIPADLPCIRLPLSPDYDAPTWDHLIKRTAPLQNPTLPKADDLATVIYTSGSTGLPKGVMHSFRTMLAGAREFNNLFSISTKDRMLSYLPLAHAAERIFIEALSLVGGTQVFFAHSLDTFVADLNRAKPTLFFSVPRLWTKFYLGINDKISPNVQKVLFTLPVVGTFVKKKLLTKLGLDHVRIAFTGSAPLPLDIINWYRRLGLELLEVYAMTENFAYSHATRPGDYRSGYVGCAQPGVDCKIDENGEILVKSPGTMLGYYKSPEKTAEDMTADQYLRTGDMGEIDAEGRLKITGRVKDIFKTSKGKYVIPVPIEQKLGNHALIESVCVGGSSLSQPVAFVMLAEAIRGDLAQGKGREEIDMQLKTLLAEINTELESHEQMDFILVVNDPWTMENDLLTPTMKIKRNKIEARYEPHLESWSKQRKNVIWE